MKINLELMEKVRIRFHTRNRRHRGTTDRKRGRRKKKWKGRKRNARPVSDPLNNHYRYYRHHASDDGLFARSTRRVSGQVHAAGLFDDFELDLLRAAV